MYLVYALIQFHSEIIYLMFVYLKKEIKLYCSGAEGLLACMHKLLYLN